MSFGAGGLTLDSASLGAVHVFEASPPAGEESIEWMLITNEKIDTPSEIDAVVDHYRARWVIVGYFKALKTGAPSRSFVHEVPCAG
ncbi:MAG TPA: hypothetical protein VGC79_31725, partial [Polyangiaceae bacterium]